MRGQADLSGNATNQELAFICGLDVGTEDSMLVSIVMR